MILFQNLWRNGQGKVINSEDVSRQIINRTIETGQRVESLCMSNALFGEGSFFLFGSDGSAGTDPDTNLAFITNGRKVGRKHFDYRKIAIGKTELRHIQRRKRLYIAIGTQCGKVQEQLIGHVQSAQAAIVVCTNNEISGESMAGEVVGKCRHCFSELIRIIR